MKSVSLKFLILAVMAFPAALRASTFYKPSSFDSKSGRLIIVLHGCLQDSEVMMKRTGWNQLADQSNFSVLYPDAPPRSNPANCWNWFLPENQKRGEGQLAVLADEIQKLQKTHQIPAARTFITGLSSGAVTASGLLACYPELFAGGALHSGPAYGSAQSLPEAEKVLKEGPLLKARVLFCDPKVFQGGLMVLQGLADEVVNPLHAKRIIKDFRGVDSLPFVEKREATGLAYQVFLASDGRTKLILVDGLGHAWSGYSGPRALPPPRYFSKKGPIATEEMWTFFKGL